MDKKQVFATNKAIEVKGMSGLSLPYIQRFFGHAGHVQEVKRVQDLVLVKFKNQGSIPKALRFSGRVIDKEPIKVRSINPNYIPLENLAPNKSKAKRHDSQDLEIEQVIADKTLNLPLLWSKMISIVSQIKEKKTKWILHEIFFLKLNQIMHFYIYKTNSRSVYLEIVLKELFVTDSRNNLQIEERKNVQKMEVLAMPNNQISDEANFEGLLAQVDSRMRFKLRDLLKTDGEILYSIYNLFHNYSIYIPNDSPIFHNNYDPNISSINSRATFTLQSHVPLEHRSEYRQIATSQPHQEIQIINDQGFLPSEIRYQIFNDNFDGNITNSCVGDLFFAFRFHFEANNIIIRKIENFEVSYIRMDFELRMLACNGQIYELETQMCSAKQIHSNCTEISVNDLKLVSHNLVIGEFESEDKILNMVTNYVQFIIGSQVTQRQEHVLNVILVATNALGKEKYNEIAKVLWADKNIASILKIYRILIFDDIKFQKLKCLNFIEQFVDQQKNLLNIEVARVHAKALISENPNKFECLPNSEDFVTHAIWRFEQEKPKRLARNRIKSQIQSARGS